VGLFDELDAHLAATGQDSTTWNDRRVNWIEICVCGHAGVMHGPSAGGTYGGPEWGKTVEGCVGPPPERGTPRTRIQPDGMMHLKATCPCIVYRPVAEVDRPARYFRQKTYTKDQIHPMVRGLKAMRTRLDNSKGFAGQGAEEAERRFRWLDGARKCRVCGAKDDTVWPSYVNDDRLSQLRCTEHRHLPIGEAP
jgi:hypothetical protein